MTTPRQSNQTQGNDARKAIESWYNILLVSSRAIALSLDPLFFFVPVIHEDKKCISEDKKMWINAIFWRSVLDFIYLVHVVVKFYKNKKEGASNTASTKHQRHPRMCFMFDIIVILPIPQVAGAFWYFFSTQRLISCWRKACLHQGGCIEGSFTCDHRFGNLSALHDFCSIDSINTSTFDFGIFLEARKSGILESTDFPKKLIYSAWWGVRNLSSYGSNLQTSTYIWENMFALGTSTFGLLLFLYLLGNLQVYMQRRASKYVEKSGEGKNQALDEAVVENILNELEQLYKQRIASKSNEKLPKKRRCCC
ncbi:cyclic nucleotide-gated ion channel 1-like isoform X1 [Castanea sativa]|uniref:cyclic nucleotide-gated ion channel 1-like isoform X1 n=1 Tax=Castanea sativa TaxID=21020 RepID=UPI003F64E834